MSRRLEPRSLVRSGASVPRRSRKQRERLVSLILFPTGLAAVVALLAAHHSDGWPLTMSALAAGQMGNQAQEASPGADPPGTIDGAKNPELIPDEVAYRMIVLAIAEPANATDAATERARAKLGPIGFSEDDAAAFLTLLSEYQTQADTLDKQAAAVYLRSPIPHPASTDYQQLVELGKQKSQLAANAVAAYRQGSAKMGLRSCGSICRKPRRE